MDAATKTLLGFAGLTIVPVTIVVSYRVLKILGGTRPDSWTRGVRNKGTGEDPAWVTRLTQAHLNLLENLQVSAMCRPMHCPCQFVHHSFTIC